jgi:preprotein translocase subunit YajC
MTAIPAFMTAAAGTMSQAAMVAHPIATSFGAAIHSLGSIASTGSTLFSGFSALQKGMAESQSHSYNSRVAAENARIAREQTAQQVEQEKRQNYLRTGAAVARSGGMTGSAMDIIADNIAQQELNILNIKHTGLMKERSYSMESKFERRQASSAKIGSLMNAGSAILTGVSKIGGG